MFLLKQYWCNQIKYINQIIVILIYFSLSLQDETKANPLKCDTMQYYTQTSLDATKWNTKLQIHDLLRVFAFEVNEFKQRFEFTN